MKNYQKPYVGTVIKENLLVRCQATANCNANIDSCDGSTISAVDGNTTPAIVIQDCQFTACFADFFVPAAGGSVTFDCGGAQQFTADFITVTPVPAIDCANSGQIAFTVAVDVTPALPDTCNGAMIAMSSGGGTGLSCLE